MNQQTEKHTCHHFMQQAIALSHQGMDEGKGGPFGAVIVKDGVVVGKGHNSVTSTNDPTAHAEVVAIRDACQRLGTFHLTGCELYTSCEPCPMCLGAIYWARPDRVYYANTREDAAAIGFDDAFIYDEVPLPLDQRKIKMIPLGREEALRAFEKWGHSGDKSLY
ncbi:MAG: nucleoside deaminase [Spirosomataceae bacterium]